MRRTIALSLCSLLLVACSSGERDEAGFIDAAQAEWTDYQPDTNKDWIAVGDDYCAKLDAMDDVATELARRADSSDPGWFLAAEHLCPRHSDEVLAADTAH